MLFFSLSPLGVEEGHTEKKRVLLSLFLHQTAAMASALHYPQSAVSLSTLFILLFYSMDNENEI